MSRDPAAFAREGYARNAVAYRCVRMIAEAAASAPLQVGPVQHPLARLLARPNPEQTGVELMESFFGHLQVAGNAYLEAASVGGDAPNELYVLRPDRMSVVPGADGWPVGWEHRVGAAVRRFDRDPVTNDAPILHLKLFHPSDARPYPAYPAREEVWADGASWRLGHWLNGRAGLSSLAEVVEHICARAGVEHADVSGLVGAMSGYIVDAPLDARGALEPLMAAFDFAAAERGGAIVFFHPDARAAVTVPFGALTVNSAASAFARRADVADTPIEARMRFIDGESDYRIGSVSARRLDRAEGGVVSVDAPLVIDPTRAEEIAQALLADRRATAEALQIELGPGHLALEPGDAIILGDGGDAFSITQIEDAEARRLELRRMRPLLSSPLAGGEPTAPPAPVQAPSPALAVIDAPVLPGGEDNDRPLVALFASPWRGAHHVYAGAARTLRASAQQPAIMGELVWPLWPGPVDRWDDGNVIRVRLYGGVLSSAVRDAVLDGANAFAIESGGEWEIVQARTCELVAPNEYQLSGFLRGQLGSAHAMRSPHPVGARIVKLDRRLARAEIGAHEWGEPLVFIAPPAGAAAPDPRASAATLVLPHAAQRPWAPAHLGARRLAGGDISISWVRCARMGGDTWGAGEPPLGATAEAYRLEIFNGAILKRSIDVAGASFLYGTAEQALDFGAAPISLRFRVSQLGENGAPGLNKELTITL